MLHTTTPNISQQTNSTNSLEQVPPHIPSNQPPLNSSTLTSNINLNPNINSTTESTTATTSTQRVEDALQYLEKVRSTFHDRKNVYDDFLLIMKNFKSKEINTEGVIEQVKVLFRNYTELIIGFNQFLPAGYQISLEGNQQNQNSYHLSVPLPQSQSQAQSQIGSGQVPVQASVSQHTNSNLPNGISHIRDEQMRNTVPQETNIAVNNSMGNGVDSDTNAHSAYNASETDQCEFNHAVEYVSLVKQRFINNPEVYNCFLGILHDFQSKQKSFAGNQQLLGQAIVVVKEQISELFVDNPDLLIKFNFFLPQEDQAPHTISSDSLQPQQQGLESPASTDQSQENHTQENQNDSSASDYVNGVDETAKLPRRSRRSHRVKTNDEFYENTDLFEELDEKAPLTRQRLARQQKLKSNKRRQDFENINMRRLRPRQSNGISTDAIEPLIDNDDTNRQEHVESTEESSYARLKTKPLQETLQEFVDQLPKSVYNAMLKLMQLYNLNIILTLDDLYLLVNDLCKNCGEDEKELSLIARFQEICSSQERVKLRQGNRVVSNEITAKSRTKSSERDEFEQQSRCFVDKDRDKYYKAITSAQFLQSEPVTPSYRRLFDRTPRLKCSARTKMMKEVLNDDYVSMAVGSEDGAFKSNQKNHYEEQLSKLEDDRYELDMLIATNASLIKHLEPLNERIQQLSVDEARHLKLCEEEKSNLDVLQRKSIMRLYGEKGTEMLDLLHNSPSTAIPVVLERIQEKDQEWRSIRACMKEPQRMIAEINSRKALDHRSLNFRRRDSRILNSNNLFHELFSSALMYSRKKLVNMLSSVSNTFSQAETEDELEKKGNINNLKFDIDSKIDVSAGGDDKDKIDVKLKPTKVKSQETNDGFLNEVVLEEEESVEDDEEDGEEDDEQGFGSQQNSSQQLQPIISTRKLEKMYRKLFNSTIFFAQKSNQNGSVGFNFVNAEPLLTLPYNIKFIDHEPDNTTITTTSTTTNSNSNTFDFSNSNSEIHHQIFKILQQFFPDQSPNSEKKTFEMSFKQFWIRFTESFFNVWLGDESDKEDDEATVKKFKNNFDSSLSIDFPSKDEDQDSIFAFSNRFAFFCHSTCLKDRLSKTKSSILFGNDLIYLLFRVHQLLFSRLSLAYKHISTSKLNTTFSKLNDNEFKNDNNEVKPIKPILDPFIHLLCERLSGRLTQSIFTQQTRQLIGYRSFEFVVIDKIVSLLAQHIKTVLNCRLTLQIFNLYFKYSLSDAQPKNLREYHFYVDHYVFLATSSYCTCKYCSNRKRFGLGQLNLDGNSNIVSDDALSNNTDYIRPTTRLSAAVAANNGDNRLNRFNNPNSTASSALNVTPSFMFCAEYVQNESFLNIFLCDDNVFGQSASLQRKRKVVESRAEIGNFDQNRIIALTKDSNQTSNQDSLIVYLDKNGKKEEDETSSKNLVDESVVHNSLQYQRLPKSNFMKFVNNGEDVFVRVSPSESIQGKANCDEVSTDTYNKVSSERFNKQLKSKQGDNKNDVSINLNEQQNNDQLQKTTLPQYQHQSEKDSGHQSIISAPDSNVNHNLSSNSEAYN